MPRPYNKQTKVDAALLCDVMASNHIRMLGDAAIALGIVNGSTAYRLAASAYYACVCLITNPPAPSNSAYAEAAELIRSGWRMGETVALRPRDVNAEMFDKVLAETYSSENVVAVAEQPHPFFALVNKELSSANDAMDAKEAALDEYGYGGPTNADLDAIESEDALGHATETVTEDIVDLSTEAG